MNPQAPQIARELFLRATGDGTVEPPEAVLQILRSLPSHAVQPLPLNTITLELQVAEQFSTWETLFNGKTLEPEQAERWVSSLRWVLQELRNWTPELVQPGLRLQLLLAALAAFDVANAGVDAVLQQLIATLLPDGLQELLEKTGGSAPNRALERIHCWRKLRRQGDVVTTNSWSF